MIPYGKQDINQQDIDAVIKVLQSDYLTQGPQVPLFEQTLIDHSGAEYAVACNSATSALHLACLVLELGVGDWLWTTPITFVASANCGLYCGAQVDFVDIDPITYNLCPKALKRKLIIAKAQNKLPKVVVPVHLCGQPCDMPAIHALSLEYDFKIIEDAAHAIGGEYQGKPIGCGDYSDITVFSFHPVKIVTTAEGGAALTNQQALADKMTLLRSHGITRDKALMRPVTGLDIEEQGDWYYQQVELGFNYRMTELQAALGVSQMQRLRQFVSERQRLASRYNQLLADLPLTLPKQLETTNSAWHLYVIGLQLDDSAFSQNRLSQNKVFRQLRELGIGVNLHYIPVHTQPYYQAMGFAVGDYPAAEHYYQHAISLPLFHGMTEAQQDEVVTALRLVLIKVY
ncbi:UDP-4-amino-4,6-dideoxy-N-acetyl-beta-L-altrosamine transaminase [Moritella sp. F3]|uniref:UDP-4-amino-4, 6-dideoxy-N-acetyl-beta-L-altrosamine transaminase n=1 Tax=Moritella sp. F3 TaxID=2718882 RepID=UPI0018E0C8C6|nr:UDP-4-amino-4,6-dideoxy-N-acetyl-beta-L-altrosamine transaminase [Moritella sp. F3]GIC77289.1 UDP-4-amino-4,6-dideoxy-N-acetyl-beta-L-altrosami ne transaminase [Moritella sp. F1]GIC83183.1 UDP-4-amino-4,6-dideoxy-N-acetyl-beta-L-altrosami ne transaminase [Moritella sp. F3]